MNRNERAGKTKAAAEARQNEQMRLAREAEAARFAAAQRTKEQSAKPKAKTAGPVKMSLGMGLKKLKKKGGLKKKKLTRATFG